MSERISQKAPYMGRMHSSLALPASSFLERWYDHDSPAAMLDWEDGGGGVRMVGSSVERNLSQRPPGFTIYEAPKGHPALLVYKAPLFGRIWGKFPNEKTSVGHHPKSHTKWLSSLPEKQGDFPQPLPTKSGVQPLQPLFCPRILIQSLGSNTNPKVLSALFLEEFLSVPQI